MYIIENFIDQARSDQTVQHFGRDRSWMIHDRAYIYRPEMPDGYPVRWTEWHDSEKSKKYSHCITVALYHPVTATLLHCSTRLLFLRAAPDPNICDSTLIFNCHYSAIFAPQSTKWSSRIQMILLEQNLVIIQQASEEQWIDWNFT
jgi:hypothetical protein